MRPALGLISGYSRTGGYRFRPYAMVNVGRSWGARFLTLSEPRRRSSPNLASSDRAEEGGRDTSSSPLQPSNQGQNRPAERPYAPLPAAPAEPSSLEELHKKTVDEYHEWVRREAEKDRRAMKKRSWWSVLKACVAATAIGTLPIFVLSQRQGTIAKAGEDVVGKPDLGGPWTLVDSSGHFVSSRDLRGRYQLIYFGFSFCPDVCPQELEKISQVVEKLEARFGPQTVQPVYISVDPQRDTVAQMASYRRDFHPSLLALTGTPAQIKAVTRLFRVYYNQGLRTGEEDYLVDHSIITYLMDRRGQFLDFFGRNMTVEEIVHKVEKYIAADQKKDQQRKGARISDESGPASARPSGRGNP